MQAPSLEMQLAILGPPAIAVLGLATARGWLRPRALADAPDRGMDLGGSDLAAVMLLLLVGVGLVRPALVLLGLPAITAPADQIGPMQRALQTIVAQLAQQGPAVVYLIGRAWGGLQRAGLLPRRPLAELGAGVAGAAVALPVVLALAAFASWVTRALGGTAPELGHALLYVFRDEPPGPALALLFLAVVGLAPLLEEAIFRGLIQSAILGVLGGRQRWLAVAIGAVVFAAIHFNVPWQVQPGLFVFGVVLGWLYERTGSLLPCVIAHAAFNGANVAMVLLLI